MGHLKVLTILFFLVLPALLAGVFNNPFIFWIYYGSAFGIFALVCFYDFLLYVVDRNTWDRASPVVRIERFIKKGKT